MTSRYSSVMPPRRWNGTPRARNSSSACPTPNVNITRPLESTSSVAMAFASGSGSWYGSTITHEFTLSRVVAPATNAITVNVCGHCEPIMGASASGITMCSGMLIAS